MLIKGADQKLMGEGRQFRLRLFPAEAKQSTADILQSLALQLQPLANQRQLLCNNVHLDQHERQSRLRQLDLQAEKLDIRLFHRCLEAACRNYCQRLGKARYFELEDFIEEVLLLTHIRLVEFDPQRGRFSTWLGSHILRQSYTDLQRRIDPAWKRPPPQAANALFERAFSKQIAQAVSLESLAQRQATDALAIPVEASESLLEEHCQERFWLALEALGEADRVLLTRIYLYGETQQEIASSLGRSKARISQRLKDICSRLAILLGSSFSEDCIDTQFCDVLRRSIRQ
jgi:RNA polymerase sigma factor (sigma-70 family)